MQGTSGPPTSVAGPTPACLAVIRASNVVLALWLLYRAYRSLSDLSVESLYTDIPSAGTCLLVAVLVLQRTVPSAVRYDAMSVAAVVVSNWHFLLIDFSPSSPAVPSVVGTVLLVGALYLAAYARVTLGRSFGLLPAVREIRTRGPYRLLRHPIYLAAILSDVGLVLAHPSARNALLAAAGTVAHVVRVQREESVLSGRLAYREYRRTTRFRLVPYLY